MALNEGLFFANRTHFLSFVISKVLNTRLNTKLSNAFSKTELLSKTVHTFIKQVKKLENQVV